MTTQGEWRTSPVLKSGATIAIQIGVGNCDLDVGDFSRVLPNNRQDSQVESTHIANAKLIVSAVNACKEVNEGNPQAVAESIKDMYDALKLYQDHQKDTSGHYCWKCAEAINDALAKADKGVS